VLAVAETEAILRRAASRIVVVGKRGTARVTVEEILERIVEPGKDLSAPAHAGAA
jgi:bifunctional ADP-heptose synthase (sugar kinase/adenylyltransferase)